MSFTLNELKEKVQEPSWVEYKPVIAYFEQSNAHVVICCDDHGNKVMNPFYHGGAMDQARLVIMKEEMSKAVHVSHYADMCALNRTRYCIEQLELLYDSLCQENDFVLK